MARRHGGKSGSGRGRRDSAGSSSRSNEAAAEAADRFARAAALTGHAFADPGLLADALTHPSLQPHAEARRARAAPFERLEFLGDRVLGLVVADLLLDRFPDEDEGALAKRHAALVSRPTLVSAAETAGLRALLLLGPSERTAARAAPGVLADAFESLIGAIYRDGGFAPARAFVVRQFASLMERAGAPPQDAKTALQEWVQARGRRLPTYRTLGASGPDHLPVFSVEVEIEGEPKERGEGTSKRSAEQDAAARLLRRLTGTAP